MAKKGKKQYGKRQYTEDVTVYISEHDCGRCIYCVNVKNNYGECPLKGLRVWTKSAGCSEIVLKK